MDTFKTVHTEYAPAAIGPYSQGIVAGDFIFTSGQIPVNPETGAMAESIKEQAFRALANVRAVLEAAGSGMNQAVKVTIFLSDMNDFSIVNEVYEEFFTPPFPARSCVAVRELPKNAKIEIEAIALREQKP